MSALSVLAFCSLLVGAASQGWSQPPGQELASSGRRIALVIGNASYASSPLRNPVHDARAFGKLLGEVGFEVKLHENLGQRGMLQAIRDFGDGITEGSVALFYFAGHGVQVRDRNYLIPVDADIRREDEIPFLSMDAALILEKMELGKSRINIMILDACRNNPFARSVRAGVNGLAPMEAPKGTIIAFATAPGKVAFDGDGEHSVYTKNLLGHARAPGLPIELMFKRVRESVASETKSTQIPWEASSLRGDFAFVPARPAVVATPQVVKPKPPAPRDESTFELAFWDAIKASTSRLDYEAYLKEYPAGRFAELARARIAAISSATPAAPASAPTPASTKLAKEERAPVRQIAGSLHEAPVGTKVQGEFKIGSKSFFLPAGDWRLAGVGGIDVTSPDTNKGGRIASVFLVDARNGQLVTAVAAAALLHIDPRIPGWRDSFCSRKDTILLHNMSASFKDEFCLIVNHYDFSRHLTSVAYLGAVAQANQWMRGQGLKSPQSAIGVRFVRAGLREKYEVEYFFNPEAAGFPPSKVADWASNDWHRDRYQAEPSRETYIADLSVWAKQMLPLIRFGAFGEGRGEQPVPGLAFRKLVVK